MLSNVILFTGEEKYLLHQELNRRTSWFVQKFGADSLFSFSSDNLDVSLLRQTIYSWGLFVNKKMILIYWMPTDLDKTNKLPIATIELFADEFMAKNWQVSPDIILIFVSYKSDKRTKFFKFLNTNASVKQFEYLKPIELKKFVRENSEDLVWNDETLEIFLSKVGTSDLYHVINELDKLIVYYWANLDKTNNKIVDKKVINLVNFWLIDSNSFDFLENLLVDKKKTLSLVKDAQDSGTNWNLFAWTLYRWLKMWLFVLDLDDQWIQDSKDIISKLKAHPFVINKIKKNIVEIRKAKQSIKQFYKNLVELDEWIKSWKKSDSYFWLCIKKNIIELF